MPFFNISNSILRIKAITFVNSFIVSCSAIPTYLIGKELGLEKKYIWYSVAVVMVWPDMLCAGTLMTESLYFLLSLICFFLCIKSINSNKIYICILAAVSCYMCYFCKEVGLCFPLAYVAASIGIPLINNFIEHKENRFVDNVKLSCKFYKEEKIYVKIIIFTITFIVCYFCVSNIIPSEVTVHDYTGRFLSITSVYSFFYFVYAVIYYIVAAIIAFMVLPIIYPIFHLKEMNKISRNSYIYSMIFLLGTILVTVFMISIKEDMGNVVPRVHLRYFFSLIGLVIPIFWSTVSFVGRKNDSSKKLESKKAWAFLGLIFIIVFKGVKSGSTTEHLGLQYFQFLSSVLPDIYGNENGSVNIYLSAFLLTVLISLFMGIWVKLSTVGNKKKMAVFAESVMLCLCLFNTVVGNVRIKKYYSVDENAIKEMQNIDNYFQVIDAEQSNVLFITDNGFENNANIYDTYFSGCNNYEITEDEFMDILIESVEDDIFFSTVTLQEPIYKTPYVLDEVDYFIFTDDTISCVQFLDGIDLLSELEGDTFYVYKNIDSSSMERKGLFENIKIDCTDKNDSVGLFSIEGLSTCEGSFTWVTGNNLKVNAYVDNTVQEVKVSFVLNNTFNGEQAVIVVNGSNVLYSGIVSGNQTFSFYMNPTEGECEFTLFLPSAVSPATLGGSDDSRVLSLALEEIDIEVIKE